MYVTSPHLIAGSLDGLSEPLYIVLILGTCLVLFKDRPQLDPLVGALFGLSWLTRSNSLFLIPGLLIWFLSGSGSWSHRIRRIGVTLGSMVLVCLPWWYRNYHLTGNPVFNMSTYLPWMFTAEYPGWTLFRTVPTSLGSPTGPEFRLLLGKFFRNLWQFAIVQRFLSCNPFILIAALFGVVTAWKNRQKQKFVWRIVLFIAVNDILTTTAICWISPQLRLYVPLLPFTYLLAVLALTHLLREGTKAVKKNSRLLFQCALISLIFSTVAYDVRFWLRLPEKPWPILTGIEIQELNEKLPSSGIIVSDLPDYLAWSLDRTVIFLPTLETFSELQHLSNEISVLHLSPNLPEFIAGEGIKEQRWLKIPSAVSVTGLGALILKTSSGHRFYAITDHRIGGSSLDVASDGYTG